MVNMEGAFFRSPWIRQMKSSAGPFHEWQMYHKSDDRRWRADGNLIIHSITARLSLISKTPLLPALQACCITSATITINLLFRSTRAMEIRKDKSLLWWTLNVYEHKSNVASTVNKALATANSSVSVLLSSALLQRTHHSAVNSEVFMNCKKQISFALPPKSKFVLKAFTNQHLFKGELSLGFIPKEEIFAERSAKCH